MMLKFIVIYLIALCEASTDTKMDAELDIEMEKTILTKIKDFLETEKLILTELKEFKNSIDKIHTEAKENEDYLKNPMHEFLIVKRIIMDWQVMATVASLNKHDFLNELHEASSHIIKQHDFPSLSNLKETVLEIADAQTKQGMNSVSEFVMTLSNEPYTKLAASEYAVFARVLKAAKKDILAEYWEMESKASQALSGDSLMEIQDFPSLLQQLCTIEA